MNAPITISATMTAWATSTHSVNSMLRYAKEGKQQDAADELFYSSGDMDKGSNPWTRVGVAEIQVTLQSQDEIVNNQLRALQAELDYARAEWLTKQQEIMDRINKLQALTNEVAAVEQP